MTPGAGFSTRAPAPPMVAFMRGKKTRPLVWMLRGGLATLGLAGAVYAADQATAPPADDVAKTITDQKIKEGTLVKPVPLDPEHQIDKLSPDQMVDLAGKY